MHVIDHDQNESEFLHILLEKNEAGPERSCDFDNTCKIMFNLLVINALSHQIYQDGRKTYLGYLFVPPFTYNNIEMLNYRDRLCADIMIDLVAD